MLYVSVLSALVAAASLVAASPATDKFVRPNTNLRLIKTSEADPGTWVTDDEKISNYVAKNIGFIDITDITVSVFAPLRIWICCYRKTNYHRTQLL